jgi:hypothetical protein
MLDLAMFPRLCRETLSLLETVPGLVREIAPVPARFQKQTAANIRALSRLLTSEREQLTGRYMGRPAFHAAYLAFFLPWNLWRLCSLFEGGAFRSYFASLATLSSPVVSDFGSGPLTLPIALWISAPALRAKEITFYCYDINKEIMKTGMALFERIAAETSAAANWKIKCIASSLSGAYPAQKPALVTAVNVYNELYQKLKKNEDLAIFAEKEAARLAAVSAPGGSVLIVEPGVPRGGLFLSVLRAHLIEKGFSIKSPCTHEAACPMSTSKTEDRAAKWCHFTFPADLAPRTFHALSRAAGLPKERGTLSFLFAQKEEAAHSKQNGQAHETHKAHKTLHPLPPVEAAHSQQNGQAHETHEAHKTLHPLPPVEAAHKKQNGQAHETHEVCARISSDAFPVQGGQFARYACGEAGLLLITGSREQISPLGSGTLFPLPEGGGERRDPKTGALIFRAGGRQRGGSCLKEAEVL